MDLTDPASPSSDRTFPEAQGNAGRAVSAVTHPSPESLSRLLVIALAAALVAGMTSLLVGEVILKAYQSDLFPRLKIRPTAEDMRRLSDAQRLSAALTFTVMGGLFGLAMGLAGGLARRSVAAGARAAILGLLLGTIAALSLALIFLPMFYQRQDPQSGDLLLPMLTHGGIWSPIGAIGGLAFGLGLGGRGRWRATLVGGLTGAAAATIVYELVGALAFASDKTDQPLSSSIATRAMAQLLVMILSAFGAVLALRQSQTQ